MNPADFTDPITRVEWRHASSLDANDYNPNVVFTPELKLLEFSMLRQGWLQPVLITPEGGIIDGFHRTSLSLGSAKLKERYGGLVPCVVMPLTRAEAMLLTIRINRAKGSHVAFRMAEIVKELIDTHGLDPQQISTEIGATADEVDLLYKDGVFAIKKIADHKYSKAWYPTDTKLKGYVA